MHQGIVDWVRASVYPEMVMGSRILDVGSLDHNGSMRPWFETMEPAEYLGIDIHEGPGVDAIVSANDILETFDYEHWDLILCLEMLEHCKDWQDALDQMKASLKWGGLLLLTTRSPGYPFHAPPDHWRFTKQLLRESFQGLENVETWSDPGYMMGDRYNPQPGVFIRGRYAGSEIDSIAGEAYPAPEWEMGNEYVNPALYPGDPDPVARELMKED